MDVTAGRPPEDGPRPPPAPEAATASPVTPVVTVQSLAKRYGAHTVFEGVDLALAAGEFVAIVGESGVGKSTLLNCIAGLDTAEAGEVRVLGQPIDRLPEAAQALLRRRHVGFVFQAFHVLPHLTVTQNVALPLLLLGRSDEGHRVREALAQVGLSGLHDRLPAQLSGGQLQRVAIARALIHRPALLLADEPSGNLDPATADSVLDALVQQVRGHGAACLLVTHSPAAAARADRVLELTPRGLRPLGGPPPG